LLISGSFGALAGHLAQSLPGVHGSPGAFALVAMAATFGAATRATFTAIVFLFELTRDYNSILPLMLATVLAVLVASFLSRDSIMTEKLTRRGLRVPSDYLRRLRTTSVRGHDVRRPDRHCRACRRRRDASVQGARRIRWSTTPACVGSSAGRPAGGEWTDGAGQVIASSTSSRSLVRHGERRARAHARKQVDHLP
jgi:hypothetical protein